MNTSSIIILFSIRKIYYILRRKSSIFMSRFFYFGGCIIRGGGGVQDFFCRQTAQATAPPAREGFCCEARFRAEQQRGGRAKLHWKFPGQKKCIVGSEISHFRAMIFLLFVYLLEKNFWSGIKHIWKKVSGLYNAKSVY